MYSESFSAAVCGIDGCVVHVEADISDGLPGLILVGYLSSEVKEGKSQDSVKKQRIQISAEKNNDKSFPC